MPIACHVVRLDRTLSVGAPEPQAGDGPSWVHCSGGNPDEYLESLGDTQLHPVLARSLTDPDGLARLLKKGDALLLRFPLPVRKGHRRRRPLTVVVLGERLHSFHAEEIPELDTIVRELTDGSRPLPHADLAALLTRICEDLAELNLDRLLAVRRELDVMEEDVEDGTGSVHTNELLEMREQVRRLVATTEDQHYVLARMGTGELLPTPPTRSMDWFQGAAAEMDQGHRLALRLEERVRQSLQQFQLDLGERTNRRLQALTILSAVFLPMGLIAGIYGMNLQGMPEAQWDNGYAFALTLMAGVAGVMLGFFWRRGWFS